MNFASAAWLISKGEMSFHVGEIGRERMQAEPQRDRAEAATSWLGRYIGGIVNAVFTT